jgi:hypothetical protein
MTLLSQDTAVERRPTIAGGASPIRIGLVNNMPDAALRMTEWQIRDLLSRAAGDLPVTLTVFSLPSVPRSEPASATSKRIMSRSRNCGCTASTD